MTRLNLLLLALLCSPLAAQAQTQAQPPAARPPADTPPPPASEVERGEPNVQRKVIEDEGSKIEETKVRGNTTRITVTPKVGTTRGYEIITEDGSRDVSDGLTGARGAAGKRVWRVLSF